MATVVTPNGTQCRNQIRKYCKDGLKCIKFAPKSNTSSHLYRCLNPCGTTCASDQQCVNNSSDSQKPNWTCSDLKHNNSCPPKPKTSK